MIDERGCPMKPSRVWIAVYFLLLGGVLFTAGWLIWNSVHLYPATPETESAFLKDYSPENVLKRFNGGQGSYSHGGGDTAGYDSVTHTANFAGYFALCSENFMPLMDALRDDVTAQLTASGAQILSQIGVAEAGFHFDYKVGKTLGSVSISPLQLYPDLGSQRNTLSNCSVGIQTRIDVNEKWFAKESSLTQVSANNSIQ